MGGWRRGWMLVGVLLVACAGSVSAQVTTTTVQDTVYRADGTAAGGSVVISWNAFTTAAGRAVPKGTTSVTIGTGGTLSVALAPNAGATPVGSYYTAVFHLNDGSTSREYWVVPVTVAGGAPVHLAAIRNSVLPTSVAMQTVSKSYVDTAIAAAVTGHPLDSSPYVVKSGDTMTGPLVLPGDPVSAEQAADKNYVDTNVTALASGLGRKVDELPGTTQVVAQPVGTELEVNNLNGSLYASQHVSGGGNNGIRNSVTSGDCTSGCDVRVERTYTSTETAKPEQLPAKTRVTDERGGSEFVTVVDPLNPGANGASIGTDIVLTSTRSAAEAKTADPEISEADAYGLRIRAFGLAGGSNQFPADIEAPPYFKSSYAAMSVEGTYNTQGQHALNAQTIHCYGVGDCLIGSQFILSSGGTRDGADEGAHPFDLQISEDTQVFAGTCTTGCTTGSTSLAVTATSAGGTQGDGRFLINKNPTKVLTAGLLIGAQNVTPFPKVNFSGTSFAVSTFLSTADAATSQPTDIAPGTVTLGIATSGVPAGFATNTAALPASSGVACVADSHALGAAGYENYEMASYTVVDSTHVRLTLNKVHKAGATIAVGGLCGYGLEQTVDTVIGIRQVFPVVGSPSGTSLYYTDARTQIAGVQGLTSAYQNFSLGVASIARNANTVTVTLTAPLPKDVNGLTLTVAGVADSSYNGNFVVTTTGGDSLTYPNTGANSTSSGGTLSLLTGGYVLYPMAEVLSVLNPSTKLVDGYLKLGANTVAWAAGDAVEEPHYFQQDVAPDVEFITQYAPRPNGFDTAGVQYQGTVSNGLEGFSVINAVPLSSYLGNGGLHTLPDSAYQALGAWKYTMTAQAGDNALFRVTCNSHGCGKWNSSYDLFQLYSATGVDRMIYSPQNNSFLWVLGTATYQFSQAGFTAGTINVGTLNATTINGGISGPAITSGTISAARLPVFGASGTTHSAGAVPDPGATAGTTRFLREDGVFAVPAGGGGGSSTCAEDLSGTYPNCTVRNVVLGAGQTFSLRDAGGHEALTATDDSSGSLSAVSLGASAMDTCLGASCGLEVDAYGNTQTTSSGTFTTQGMLAVNGEIVLSQYANIGAVGIDGDGALVDNAGMFCQSSGANCFHVSVSNATATKAASVTSVTCATATCTNVRGTYTVVGGTFTTGTLFSLSWGSTATPYVCSASVINASTGASVGSHSVATATGMNISALSSAAGLTLSVDYSCQP